MPVDFVHNPAQIIQALLIKLGHGNALGAGDWPCYYGSEPAEGNQVIVVRNTVGTLNGRIMFTGERPEHPGIQVLVRAGTNKKAFEKARAIAIALDEDVYQDVVRVEGNDYLVHSFSRTGTLADMGKNAPTDKLSRWTINGMVTLEPHPVS